MSPVPTPRAKTEGVSNPTSGSTVAGAATATAATSKVVGKSCRSLVGPIDDKHATTTHIHKYDNIDNKTAKKMSTLSLREHEGLLFGLLVIVRPFFRDMYAK